MYRVCCEVLLLWAMDTKENARSAAAGMELSDDELTDELSDSDVKERKGLGPLPTLFARRQPLSRTDTGAAFGSRAPGLITPLAAQSITMPFSMGTLVSIRSAHQALGNLLDMINSQTSTDTTASLGVPSVSRSLRPQPQSAGPGSLPSLHSLQPVPSLRPTNMQTSPSLGKLT